MKTKTKLWRHTYHDIEIPRPKKLDIEIPNSKNENSGTKTHDKKKRRNLSHDIVYVEL